MTPHPGTTRDTIECTLDLRGIPLTLIDTAGLRASEDPVERLGIERAWREIERADLVVLVRDVTAGAGPELGEAGAAPALGEGSGGREPELVVYNKVDLAPGFRVPEGEAALAVSCALGSGLERLEAALAARLMQGSAEGGDLGLAINPTVAQRSSPGQVSRHLLANETSLGPPSIYQCEPRAWLCDRSCRYWSSR